MAIRKIMKEEEDILRKTSRDVEVFDRKLKILVGDMIETLKKEDGMGLAAVQVGILKNVFIIDIKSKMVEFVNPILHEISEATEIAVEGCLSCTDKWEKVERPMSLKITAQNIKGEKFTMSLEGLEARCACHEFDHLHGGLFLDKVVKFEKV